MLFAEFVTKIIDNGEINLQETYAQALRLKEAISVVESELKSNLLQENFEAFGLKGTFKNGGNTINYSEDEVYAEIKKKLDDRVELLKTDLKTDAEFYDSDGVLVPKVSTTPRKSSLAISF